MPTIRQAVYVSNAIHRLIDALITVPEEDRYELLDRLAASYSLNDQHSHRELADTLKRLVAEYNGRKSRAAARNRQILEQIERTR